MSRIPALVGNVVRLSVPPVTATMPVLVKPPAGLTVATVAVLLLKVPVLLKTLPIPVFCCKGAVLVPARFQVPALLTTPLPLKLICPAPLEVTTPPSALVQVRESAAPPVTLVAPLVVRVPVPPRAPPLMFRAPAMARLPLPPSVPKVERLTAPTPVSAMLLPVLNVAVPLARFRAPVPITVAPLARV